MTNDLIKVTKMIARQMVQLSAGKDKNTEILGVFMGLGIALGHCYTISTGNPCGKMKPQDIIKWAAALPLDKDEVSIHLQ